MSQSDALSSSSERSGQPSSTHSSGGRWRRYMLFALLLLMLGALWYDRKVARLSVESAYDRVERLNLEINSKGGRKYITNKDVQAELNREPTRVFPEGGYQVEVYSWRAGLPIMTRDYYAVFSSGSPPIFLKHYKFELPKEELTGQSALSVPNDIIPVDHLPPPPTASGAGPRPGSGGGGRPGKRTEDRRPTEGAATERELNPEEGVKPAKRTAEPAKSEKPSEQPAEPNKPAA